MINGVEITVRPPVRSAYVPRTRWQYMEGHTLWTRAAMSALKEHGSPLVEMVPRDIDNWCPAYTSNDDQKRRAFWVGYMSALAKHESTYKPWAVGGGTDCSRSCQRRRRAMNVRQARVRRSKVVRRT
jgi:hypothetical protein